MIFTEISKEELNKFQKENDHRYFFPQNAIFKTLSNQSGLKPRILAVKENNKILAYGIFLYFRQKKFFYKVTTQYGPIMDYTNEKLVKFYFNEMKNYFKEDWRVLSIYVSPFLNEKIFKDIEEIEKNETAFSVDNNLTNLGFTAMNQDAFENPLLALRCVYSKELAGITQDNLLKNISLMAKRNINKTIKEGVLVREIDIFNKEDAKIFDMINRETEKRINSLIRDNSYFENIKNTFKNKSKLILSYIDCDNFINNAKKEIDKLMSEKVDLSERLLTGKVNKEKTINKIARLEESISIWQKKIDNIKKLQQEEGNIIYLSCASFLESGQDFIYLTGAALHKFFRFEGPYAVMFEMIKYAISKNFKYFNFFGTSKDFSENSTDYGVLQFKRNFNGNVEWFMDNYELKNNLGKILPW